MARRRTAEELIAEQARRVEAAEERLRVERERAGELRRREAAAERKRENHRKFVRAGQIESLVGAPLTERQAEDLGLVGRYLFSPELDREADAGRRETIGAMGRARDLAMADWRARHPDAAALDARRGGAA